MNISYMIKKDVKLNKMIIINIIKKLIDGREVYLEVYEINMKIVKKIFWLHL